MDNVLFDHFRAHQVDRIFAGAGFSLDSEAEIELHNDQFAWDADAVSITMDDFEYQNPLLLRLPLSPFRKMEM